MADHSELIAELPQVEKMTTQDRLKHARKRRMQQLKKWSQREKEYYRESNSKKKRIDMNNMQKKSKRADCQIHFVPSVMMLEAAARGDVEEVKRLLMMGVDPDSTNEDGLTALHQCCIDNNEEMMKLLVEFGANVNAEDSERWTPLHAAATCGHQILVKYLISKGANLLAVNADGNMPYDICEDETTLDYIETEMSRRGVTQEIIDDTRGAIERTMLNDMRWIAQQNGDLEFKDNQGATPLHIAAANGYLNVVEFLLEHSVSADAVDDDLWQPIHAAACWGHLDVLEALVQYGATLDAKTKNGETPFDICEDMEMKDRMVQLKNELEIKKSTQTQRLRRSQSQNTRSQSVRRTSIRDKTHMTRKEALDEAKIRLVHQGIDVEQEKLQDKENNGSNGSDYTPPVVDHISVSINGKPKQVVAVAPFSNHSDTQINKTETNDDYNTNKINTQDEVTAKITMKRKDNNNELINEGDPSSVHNKQNSAPSPYSNGSELSNSPSSNQTGPDVTLDLSIHVTVNAGNGSYPVLNNGVVMSNGQSGHGTINNNTLAELKRQRQDLRKRNGNSKSQDTQSDRVDSAVIPNGHRSSDNKKERASGNKKTHTPPSPSISLRKYTGVTAGEEVENSKQKLNCCTIV